MAVSMRAIGVKESITAKEYMRHPQEPNMMVIGRWASIMGSAHSHGLMAPYIRESGGTAERTEEANSQESMEQFMKGSGRTANIMAKVS
jgi:hypothetical protein